jgi:hypothetical protein
MKQCGGLPCRVAQSVGVLLLYRVFLIAFVYDHRRGDNHPHRRGQKDVCLSTPRGQAGCALRTGENCHKVYNCHYLSGRKSTRDRFLLGHPFIIIPAPTPSPCPNLSVTNGHSCSWNSSGVSTSGRLRNLHALRMFLVSTSVCILSGRMRFLVRCSSWQDQLAGVRNSHSTVDALPPPIASLFFRHQEAL